MAAFIVDVPRKATASVDALTQCDNPLCQPASQRKATSKASWDWPAHAHAGLSYPILSHCLVFYPILLWAIAWHAIY